MKTVGVLFGLENTFPGSLVERINAMQVDGVRAEFVEMGGVEMASACPYAVIVDRISHDMPLYRAYLKNAVLGGTWVINNPFWWSADDKFFDYSLAAKLGVAVPRTMLLPNKHFPPRINHKSLRNLQFPLDWDGIFGYVKFPAFLKPHDGGGGRDVFYLRNTEEFFHAYDQTRDMCMVLQAAVNFQEYFRCYVVGQEEVRIMPYDPMRPLGQRYVLDAAEGPGPLLKRMEMDALTLCRALGYDLNTVEFAVEDGVPYAIDFMNPAPDVDLQAVGRESFDWIVDRVAKLAVKKAQEWPKPVELRWAALLGREAAVGAATKAPAKKRAVRKGVPK